jgi:hypothetical protein
LIFNVISDLKDSFKRKPISLDMDDASAKSVIEQYNALKLSADAYAEKTNLTNETMKSYLSTVESGSATFDGCREYVDKANKSIGLTGVKAKAASVGIHVLNAALSMGISLIAGFLVGKIVEGLDYLIHRSERISEAAETSKKKIDELKSSFDELEKSANNIRKIRRIGTRC